MDDSNEKITIQLLIGREQFPVTVTRSNEAIFRRAARNVNETLAKYKERYPTLTDEKNIATTLLQYAVRALQLEDEQQTKPFIESLSSLSEEIEETLK